MLYALQCFIATCIDPSGAAFAGNTDNAFYAVAKMAAGPWLMIVCAVGVALAQGVFTAIAQQTADMVPPNSNFAGLNRLVGEKFALSGCCTTNITPHTTNSARITS